MGNTPSSSKKYPERTSPLLFLYLENSDAYLINIHKHGDWTEKSVLQVMQDNWPHLLEPYIFKDATQVLSDSPEKSHQEQRKSGSFILIELQDKEENTIVLAPPGLGLASSKDAVRDVSYFDYQMDLLTELENNIYEHQTECRTANRGRQIHQIIFLKDYDITTQLHLQQRTLISYRADYSR